MFCNSRNLITDCLAPFGIKRTKIILEKSVPNQRNHYAHDALKIFEMGQTYNSLYVHYFIGDLRGYEFIMMVTNSENDASAITQQNKMGK